MTTSGIGASRSAAAALIVAGAVLLSNCSATYVASEVSARAQATNAGIGEDDREALNQGNLALIRDKYANADWSSITIAQLSLLCDVEIKFGAFDRAKACLDRYGQRLQSGDNTENTAHALELIRGKRALIELAIGNPDMARALLTGQASQGAQYVWGLATLQLARQAADRGSPDATKYNADVRSIAARLAMQFDPAPVYYAASLYAAAGDCQASLALLNEPERRLLRDYGLSSSQNAFGSTIHVKPFRLDIFGEFSFGALMPVTFAPAANVYVEYLAARCLHEVHRDGEARQRYDTLLDYPNVQAYRDIYWRALADRAQLAAADHDTVSAIQDLRKSVDTIEAVRSSIATEHGRIAFVDDKHTVYSRLVELLIQTKQSKAALEYVERSRSRAFVDLLSSRQQIGITAEDATLVADNDRVEADLVGASAIAPDGITARTAAVDSQHALIRQRAPRLAPLITVPPAQINDIQAKLGSDEAAIVFFESGRRWWVFVLRADSVSIHPITATNLEADIASFRSVLIKPRASKSVVEAQQLYADLLAEPLRGLKEKRLVIVATGPLHHIAMAALHDGKQYLVERYAINTVPSLSTFLLSYPHRVGAGGLIIGDPGKGGEFALPQAEEEARAVASYAHGSKLLIGPEATIQAIRTSATGYRFFHFAGHGLYDQDDPLRSAIMLAPSSGRLSPLTAGDLFHTRLDVDLAVLSGCSTGLGQITTGDDVIGLVRGFLYAGPKTVVGSLWAVDDSKTATFMKSFYRSYLAGKPPPDALRDAQLDQIKSQSAPFFWASLFVTSVQE